MNQEKIDEQKAMDLMNKMEKLFVAEEATVPQALRALLILSAVNANNLHMSQKTFVNICASVYQSDNEVRNMDLN